MLLVDKLFSNSLKLLKQQMQVFIYTKIPLNRHRSPSFFTTHEKSRESFESVYIHSTFLMSSKLKKITNICSASLVLVIKELKIISERTYPKLSLKSKQTNKKRINTKCFSVYPLFPFRLKCNSNITSMCSMFVVRCTSKLSFCNISLYLAVNALYCLLAASSSDNGTLPSSTFCRVAILKQAISYKNNEHNRLLRSARNLNIK